MGRIDAMCEMVRDGAQKCGTVLILVFDDLDARPSQERQSEAAGGTNYGLLDLSGLEGRIFEW